MISSPMTYAPYMCHTALVAVESSAWPVHQLCAASRPHVHGSMQGYHFPRGMNRRCMYVSMYVRMFVLTSVCGRPIELLYVYLRE